MHKAIAKNLYVDCKYVYVTFGGLNHMGYATGVYVNSEDKTEYVLNKWGNESMNNITGTEWANAFIRELGAIPSPYHRYYYMAKETLEESIKNYEKNGTRAENVKRLEDELFELYKDENLKEKPKQLEKRGEVYYSDAACNLISSIYNDKGDIQVVNTVNKGVMEEFEYNEVVEISFIITKNGPIPIAVGRLPKCVKGLVQQIKSFEVADCEAAVTGEYEKALLTMMINPLVQSQKYAKIVLDELLEAHKEYLPKFNK